jgi:hypothetical protein
MIRRGRIPRCHYHSQHFRALFPNFLIVLRSFRELLRLPRRRVRWTPTPPSFAPALIADAGDDVGREILVTIAYTLPFLAFHAAKMVLTETSLHRGSWAPCAIVSAVPVHSCKGAGHGSDRADRRGGILSIR